MKPISFILSLIFLAGIASADVSNDKKDQPADLQNVAVKAADADVSEAYTGKMPDNDNLKVTEEHKVIATFQGIHESKSVFWNAPTTVYAEFNITDYLHYKKIAQGDRPKRGSYRIQIASLHLDADDLRRKRIEEIIGMPLTAPAELEAIGVEIIIEPGNGRIPHWADCDPSLLAYLKTLEKGDQVVIEWKDLFGRYRSGKTTWSTGPQETLLLLKKIDQAEAKQLTTDAASVEPAQHE